MRLVRLEIEDFALIARADLEFAEGFTVCTGETGSGKTMLLGALRFVLGERASNDIVRANAARARVTLEVEPDAPLHQSLESEGFEAQAGENAIFARELTAGGKSTARINGRLATSAQLRLFGESIVEQIGQHEQQRLLSRAYQLELLDAFAGDDALAKRGEIARAYERVGLRESALSELSESVGRALAELEFARFALREIDEAAVLDDEDLRLRERRDYLANVERIAATLASAHEALAGSEASAVEALGTATAALATIERYGPKLAGIAATVASLQSEANDVAAAVARELDASEFDAEELETTTARLDALERLKKKYGGSIGAIREARTRFAETVERETTRDEREASLRAELELARAQLRSAANELSALRAQAARAIEKEVVRELGGLAMPAARFAVVLEPLAQIGLTGAESVEFGLSPNPGEPIRALARAASGGELARVLLALVVVLAGRRDQSALIFDEIDAGIGGATANAVGIRLGALAHVAQVLCVTHLAQIASWADRHYTLRKRDEAGATTIELVPLEDEPAILAEVARMLSGSAATIALEHAEALVREVRKQKAGEPLRRR